MKQKIDFSKLVKQLIVNVIFPLSGLLILITVTSEWEPRGHWHILFTYAIVTIICSFAPVSSYNARVTINSAVIFSGILLYGTWAGIWSAIMELLIVTLIFRTQISKALANIGQVLLTVWIVGSLHVWLSSYSIPWMITDLILIVVFWATNTCLVAIGISYFFHVKWSTTFKSLLTGASLTYILIMIMGGIGARLVEAFGLLSLLPLSAAFLATSFVFHQYYKGLHKLQQKVDQVNSLNNSFLTAMAASIDARDPYTHGHSQRVAYWGRELAIALKLDKAKIEEVYFGGILHDIGKIGIEDDILNKEGKLTKEEYDKIKMHPVIGYQILEQAGVFQELLPAIRSHHERIDGKGYPDELTGLEIPEIARILAISDAFDAMVSDRPYRRGMPIEVALERIKEGAGTQFDEAFAEVFIQLVQNRSQDELQMMTKHDAQKQIATS